MYNLMINTDLEKSPSNKIMFVKSPKKYIEHYFYKEIKQNGKKKQKVHNDDFRILNLNEYDEILRNNYNVSQLKKMCKYHKYKVSGNKTELIKRIYNNMRLSYYAVKIQSIVRSNFVKKLMRMKKVYLYKNSTNDIDFLTLESINKLKISQIICLESGEKNHVYSFDICSLYNLFKEKYDYAKKHRKNLKKYLSTILNPFNRQPLPENIHKQLHEIVKYTKICGLDINITIDNNSYNEDIKKKNIFNAIELFQTIDTFGFITDSKWFMDLNTYKLSKFMKELMDVWDYRAQLTSETSNKIYPSSLGYPFRIRRQLFQRDIEGVRSVVLKTIGKFINAGVDHNSQSLAVFYVLGALTIVSKSAAENLPWLYESFCQLS